MINQMKRVACLIVDRANYGRVRPVLLNLKGKPGVDLSLIVSGTMMLDRFGRAEKILEEDGFEISGRVYVEIEGSVPFTMAKSLGIAVSEFSNEFQRLKPDMLVVIGDRYEALGAVIAAAYMNICIVHIQGGEVSGSIDESARHAITKFSHYHFPATERSREYIIRMGENPDHVFNYGCPVVDVINESLATEMQDDVFKTGVGYEIKKGQDYLLVINHPVTTDMQSSLDTTDAILGALDEIGMPTIWLWPNIDAGADSISHKLRVYREHHDDKWLRLVKNFTPKQFQQVLNKAKCAIGNSSSFVRDSGFMGTPVVLVGKRQFGREYSQNVVCVSPDRSEVFKAINNQLKHGRYERSDLYGKVGAGAMIADKIVQLKPISQKHLHFIWD